MEIEKLDDLTVRDQWSSLPFSFSFPFSSPNPSSKHSLNVISKWQLPHKWSSSFVGYEIRTQGINLANVYDQIPLLKSNLKVSILKKKMLQ